MVLTQSQTKKMFDEFPNLSNTEEYWNSHEDPMQDLPIFPPSIDVNHTLHHMATIAATSSQPDENPPK